MKQTKIIAVLNHKGGTGKTTTAVNVGGAMARRGLDVLLVDLDAQCNLTFFLNGDAPVERGIFDAMKGGGELPVLKYNNRLYFVPSTAQMAALDVVNPDTTRLSKLLNPLRGVFDYIILDSPPGLGVATYNAVVACEHVIVVIEPCMFSLNGLDTTFNAVKKIRNSAETMAVVDGIVLTRYKSRRLHKSVEEVVRSEYGEVVFNTVVHENIKIAEGILLHKTAYEIDKRCNGAKDYTALTREIVERYNVKL